MQDEVRNELLEDLRAWMPKGCTVFTVIRKVARDGMSREIGLVVIDPETGKTLIHPTWKASQLLDIPVGKKEGIVMGGCGMDFGYDLVRRLAIVLYDDARAFKHEWI